MRKSLEGVFLDARNDPLNEALLLADLVDTVVHGCFTLLDEQMGISKPRPYFRLRDGTAMDLLPSIGTLL